MTRPYLGLTLFSALLVGAACSSDPTEPEPATGGSSGTSSSGAGGSGGSAQGPGRCPEGENPRSPPNPIEVTRITGELVDEQGEPTNAGLVQVCGRDVCTQANVGSNGRLLETVGDTRDTPALKYGDGFEWAKLTHRLEAGDNDVGTLVTVRLPSYDEGAVLAAGKSASSAGVTLTLDASAHVDVNFLDYETEGQQSFRAAALPPAALEQLAETFVQGYALSPLETHVCPPPALTLQNTEALEPGTELELYLLGLDVEEEFAPYAGWKKIGEGAVSEDGTTLDFPDGVPVLTAIGVKVKE